MVDPQDLFVMAEDLPPLDHPVLIQALEGFVDAGHGARLARDHILATCAPQTIATFDVDQLFDYRARRPEMIFATDHWESFARPELTLQSGTDLAGNRFLILSGPEPDVQWERFVAAVQLIAQRLQVRLVIGLDAIPMGVPHTRPASIIAHGQPRELVADYHAWLGTVQVPASAGHLLEFRMGEAGVDSMGFAVNVPHYLAQMEYPESSLTLLEAVAKAGDLEFDLADLGIAAASVRANVDDQVAASEEVRAVVAALEQQYDSIVAGRAENGLVADGASLPTADELGAEFERYLARETRPGDEEH